jgi:hypothetical protein
MIAKGSFDSNNPITIKVYRGGSMPGEIIAKKLLNPTYTDYTGGRFYATAKKTFSHSENYLRFDSSLSVGKDFFIGYQISYPVSSIDDSLYLYAASRKEPYNTAFFQQGQTWRPFTAHPLKPVSTSIWIEPIIQKDTTSRTDTLIEDTDSVYLNKPRVLYENASHTLTIYLPADWNQPATISIFDLSGRLIYRSQLTAMITALPFPARHSKFSLYHLVSSTQQSMGKLIVR